MKYEIYKHIQTISIQLQWRIHDTTWHNGVAKPPGVSSRRFPAVLRTFNVEEIAAIDVGQNWQNCVFSWSDKGIPGMGKYAGTPRLGNMGMGQYLLIPFLVGMNIHLPAILMFTRGTRFWPTAIWRNEEKSWKTMGNYGEICKHFGKICTKQCCHISRHKYPTCRGASTGGCWCGTISSSKLWSCWNATIGLSEDWGFWWILIFLIREKYRFIWFS